LLFPSGNAFGGEYGQAVQRWVGVIVADNGLQLFALIFIYQLAGGAVFGGLAQDVVD